MYIFFYGSMKALSCMISIKDLIFVLLFLSGLSHSSDSLRSMVSSLTCSRDSGMAVSLFVDASKECNSTV